MSRRRRGEEMVVEEGGSREGARAGGRS